MPRSHRPCHRIAALVAVLALGAAACGDNGGDSGSPLPPTSDSTEPADEVPTSGSGGASDTAEFETVRVPADHATVQAAVDAAASGDLVLIEAGVYEEEVEVATDGLTIRGVDRDATILEGGDARGNGFRIEADGVAVENLTVQGYMYNGLFWLGADGYRASYVTAFNNAGYGIYALDSVNGLFEHSYASGSSTGAFYIGQCFPCNAVVRNVVGEWSGLGYSGTNAGGDVYIVDSVFRNNRAGIVPNSGSYELCYPQRSSVIAGNLVHSSTSDGTPPNSNAVPAGSGIIVAGGRDNLVLRNRIVDSTGAGIALAPFVESSPFDDIPAELAPCDETRDDELPPRGEVAAPLVWDAEGNEVRENVALASGLFDLLYGTVGDVDEPFLGNCFADNEFVTASPEMIEQLAPCEGPPTGDTSSVDTDISALLDVDGTSDLIAPPAPDPQPSMDDPEGSPPAGTVGVPPVVDLEAIVVPDGP